jgi:hypothetical protein
MLTTRILRIDGYGADILDARAEVFLLECGNEHRHRTIHRKYERNRPLRRDVEELTQIEDAGETKYHQTVESELLELGAHGILSSLNFILGDAEHKHAVSSIGAPKTLPVHHLVSGGG